MRDVSQVHRPGDGLIQLSPAGRCPAPPCSPRAVLPARNGGLPSAYACLTFGTWKQVGDAPSLAMASPPAACATRACAARRLKLDIPSILRWSPAALLPAGAPFSLLPSPPKKLKSISNLINRPNGFTAVFTKFQLAFELLGLKTRLDLVHAGGPKLSRLRAFLY